MNHEHRPTGNAALDSPCDHGNALGRDQRVEGQPENRCERAPDGVNLDRRRSDSAIRDDQHIPSFTQLLAAIYCHAGKVFSRGAVDQHPDNGAHRLIRLGDSRRPVESSSASKGNPRETQNVLITSATMLALCVAIISIIVEVVNR